MMDFKRQLFLFLNIAFVSKVVGIDFLIPISNSTFKIQRQQDKPRARIEDHPYAVQIYKREGEDTGNPYWQYTCTGALIAPQIIITAAHCVYVTKYYGVNAGENITYNFLNWRLVVNKRLHPLFENIDQTEYNVALLKLERSYTYTDKIKRICICWNCDWEYKAHIKFNISGEIVGWMENGRQGSVIEKVKLEVTNRNICSNLWKTHSTIFEGSLQHQMHEHRICSGFCLKTPDYTVENGGSSEKICGPSIGALFVKNNQLFGIESRILYQEKGHATCQNANYWFHSKLSYYGVAHWIEATRKELQRSIPNLNG
ncbi:trypsin-like [Chrysoperla carnea]|uniref:trypsin-like n=1 Tax=Chrysoperla carnea TaxID=189513 RepID=UPI001D089D29|nr:trypsin-like [Chrysoperla carnea]